jgi:hypothetical protein
VDRKVVQVREGLQSLTRPVARGGVPAAACGFIARGTRVATPQRRKAIEDLQVGQEILAVDPLTGRRSVATVTGLVHDYRECVGLGFGERDLLLTADHPLFCPQGAVFAPAGDWALRRRLELLDVQAEALAPVAVDTVSSFAGLYEVLGVSISAARHGFVANGVVVYRGEPIEERVRPLG